MARILLMIASLASLLVCLAVSDAEAAVLIKPIVKPGFKVPRYAVTGQGRHPLIGDRITVESGATGQLKVTVHRGKDKKTINSPSVELEGNRISPAGRQGIELNGNTYSSAVLEKPKWKSKGQSTQDASSQTYYKIVLESGEEKKTAEQHPIHGHIEIAHSKDKSSGDDCKQQKTEQCEQSRH